MTVHPKNQKDLLLAPVAAEIDRNLQRLRGDSPRDVIAELELELDRPAMYADPDERAALVLRVDGRRERGGGGHACVSPIRMADWNDDGTPRLVGGSGHRRPNPACGVRDCAARDRRNRRALRRPPAR